VQVEPRVARELPSHRRALVGVGVIGDQVQVEGGGRLVIDRPQEADELPAALARQAFPDDLAIQQAT
jgi:hypothetical protein